MHYITYLADVMIKRVTANAVLTAYHYLSVFNVTRTGVGYKQNAKFSHVFGHSVSVMYRYTVLEDKVLVLRRLEDKIKVLVLVM